MFSIKARLPSFSPSFHTQLPLTCSLTKQHSSIISGTLRKSSSHVTHLERLPKKMKANIFVKRGQVVLGTHSTVSYSRAIVKYATSPHAPHTHHTFHTSHKHSLLHRTHKHTHTTCSGEKPVPRPGVGEALIKMTTTSICGSDLQIMSGGKHNHSHNHSH